MVFVTLAGDAIAVDDAAWSAFTAQVRGDVVIGSDVGFEETRRVWNATIDRRPGAIVRCAGAADVLASVRFAREQDLLVSVRGGGHNVAGRAVADGALMVDLSAMRGVRVDPLTHTDYVAAGVVVARSHIPAADVAVVDHQPLAITGVVVALGDPTRMGSPD